MNTIYKPSLRLQDDHRGSIERTNYMRKIEAMKQASVQRGYVQCTGVTRWGKCPKNVNERVESFSKSAFGRILCWDCQQEERKK